MVAMVHFVMPTQLTMDAEPFIATIRSLEAALIKAAAIAVRMQPGIAAKKKSDTGTYEVDVVTEADAAVQEAVLAEWSRTNLTQCRLVAEESTPSDDRFNPKGKMLLTLDPIDGTYRYAEGKPVYSLIVGIQWNGQPLYTFVHYPAFGWSHRFVFGAHEEFGARPSVRLLQPTNGAISYPYGNPRKTVPDPLQQDLKARGYSFVDWEQLARDSGAMFLLLLNRLQGYYHEDPLVVDGLVGLHYAASHRWEALDRRTTRKLERGRFGLGYPGFYIILKR